MREAVGDGGQHARGDSMRWGTSVMRRQLVRALPAAGGAVDEGGQLSRWEGIMGPGAQ